jgi:hypothetical protein
VASGTAFQDTVTLVVFSFAPSVGAVIVGGPKTAFAVPIVNRTSVLSLRLVGSLYEKVDLAEWIQKL